MEEIVKTILPGLAKSFPVITGTGLIIFFVTKLIVNYLEKRDGNREKYFVDEMNKREKYFVDEMASRDKSFISQIEKRDLIYKETIEKKDKAFAESVEYYQQLVRDKDAAMQVLNDKLVAVTNRFIEVTKENSVVIGSFRDIILQWKNNNR